MDIFVSFIYLLLSLVNYHSSITLQYPNCHLTSLLLIYCFLILEQTEDSSGEQAFQEVIL